jgi:rhamnopyranosyl-N-acetylglucosaminyl-diphospho-decaprenol beta-1,3/1,4-galactofuranosyltransferase
MASWGPVVDIDRMCALHGVLVTFRRDDQLRDYFGALASQTRSLETLVVVDNDPDGSARATVVAHGLSATRVEYVANGDNLGPAGGIAIGMRRLLEHATDEDWIITLDDDDPPRSPMTIETLGDFAEDMRRADPRVGGVGLCGGRFDLSRGRFRTVRDAELVGPVRSSWVGGNQFPCYSVPAVRVVGVFDERFFINFEELDYGLRMADHGFAIYAHGDVWRDERARLGRADTELAGARRLGDPDWRRYYSLRNLVFLLRQRGRRRVALQVSGVSLAKTLYNFPRSPRPAWAHLRLNARAVADAYRGRMGRTVEPVPKPYVRRT